MFTFSIYRPNTIFLFFYVSDGQGALRPPAPPGPPALPSLPGWALPPSAVRLRRGKIITHEPKPLRGP
jgi:hypothetical protein